jgi:hypothetical protein
MEFLFPRRIARIPYLVRTIALAIVVALVVDHLESGKRSVGAALFIVALVAYWAVFVVAARCRDLAMSSWFAFLALVPGVDLFFCGYLAWGRSKVRAESDSGRSRIATDEKKSEPLLRLEALQDEGVLTEQDFVRRKARLAREEKG